MACIYYLLSEEQEVIQEQSRKNGGWKRYLAAIFDLVRLAAHVTNGCKFQIRPSSGKDIAKTKGVLFTAMAVINVRGI